MMHLQKKMYYCDFKHHKNLSKKKKSLKNRLNLMKVDLESKDIDPMILKIRPVHGYWISKGLKKYENRSIHLPTDHAYPHEYTILVGTAAEGNDSEFKWYKDHLPKNLPVLDRKDVDWSQWNRKAFTNEKILIDKYQYW